MICDTAIIEMTMNAKIWNTIMQSDKPQAAREGMEHLVIRQTRHFVEHQENLW